MGISAAHPNATAAGWRGAPDGIGLGLDEIPLDMEPLELEPRGIYESLSAESCLSLSLSRSRLRSPPGEGAGEATVMEASKSRFEALASAEDVPTTPALEADASAPADQPFTGTEKALGPDSDMVPAPSQCR